MDWWTNGGFSQRGAEHGESERGQQDFAKLSFGDAMSALLFAFMLIALVYMMIARLQSQMAQEAQHRAEEAEQEIIRLREEIDAQVNQQRVIIGQLTEQLRANGVEVVPDPITGDLSIRENLLFDVGRSELKPEGQEFIHNLIAAYVDVIYAEEAPPEFRETVARIVVEGYTSSEGDPLMNMNLGADRAISVYDFAINDPALAPVRASAGWVHFERALLISSRGALDADPVARSEDRRVLFRFQFRTVESVLRLLEEAGFGDTTIGGRQEEVSSGEGPP